MAACPYCGTVKAQRGLCDKCLTLIREDWDRNQKVVRAYMDAGFSAMYSFLAKHALFSDWLLVHGQA